MRKSPSRLLTLVCILAGLPGAARAGSLPFGLVVSVSVTSAGQTIPYTFTGNAGEVIDFTVVTTSGSLSPRLQLFNSSRTLIASASNNFCSGSTLEMNAVTLPAAGTYTLDVSDCSATNTGNYDLYAQSTNQPAGAVNLPFAQVQTDTIASAAQSYTYTFSANANDILDFTMVTTGGTLSPKIRLYQPNGTLVSQAWNNFCSGATLEMNGITLPVAGTYTVLFADCADTNSGNYVLYTQRTNNPLDPVNLPFAQVQTGAIGSAAQTNTYTFSADANDVLDFTMVTTSGSLSPKIRLYQPNGTLVTQAWNNFCSGSALEMNAVTLPATGTYTVLFADCADTNSGDYAIYTQRTNDPSGAVTLPFAQTKGGSITSVAQSNTYTFSANAGDAFDFTMAATSGSLSPKIRLYEPNGTLVTQAWNNFCSGSTLEMNTVTLPVTGTYTALFADCADTNTGNYEIYLQRLDHPYKPSAFVFGKTQTGGITLPTQSNTYTFTGSKGEILDFTMVTTSGTLSPKVRLYEPNGTLVTEAWNNFCSGSTLEMNTVALPVTGAYTVLFGDCADVNSGNYVIYSQRTSNPPGAPTLLFGPVQNGMVNSAAQSNTYIFSANANDVFDFTIVTTSGTLSPKIRLYQPNGTLVSQTWNNFCSGGTLEMDTVKLPVTGIYTVFVADCSDVLTGNYQIYGQSTNNPFGPGPVLWGQAHAATVGSATLSNTYTFSGTASNVVDLTMTATSGSLSPKIRLYNPDGSLLATAYNNFCSGPTITLSSVTLAQTGDYTVLLGDCSDANTGSYNLSSQCSGACPLMPALTWATPAPMPWGTHLGSTQLDASANVSGRFVYSPPSGTILSVGPHDLAVTFTPDDTTDYSTARGRVQLAVIPAPTSTSLTSSLNPSNFGQSVTFTAAVTSSTATPAGAVTFKDGAKTLGTGALKSGVATFTTSTLSVATHSITAVYGGNTDFTGSTSPVLSQVVN